MQEDGAFHELHPPAAAGMGEGVGEGTATAVGDGNGEAGAARTASSNRSPSPKRMRVLLDSQAPSSLSPASEASPPSSSCSLPSSSFASATALADPISSYSSPPSPSRVPLSTLPPDSATGGLAVCTAPPVAPATGPPAAADLSAAVAFSAEAAAFPAACAAAEAAGRAPVCSGGGAAPHPTTTATSSEAAAASPVSSSCPSDLASSVLCSLPSCGDGPPSPVPPTSTGFSLLEFPDPACSSALPSDASASPSSSSPSASAFLQVSSSFYSSASAASTSCSSSPVHSLLRDYPSSAVPLTSSGGGDRVEARRAALTERYLAYLRSIKDNWSSCHAARLLTPTLLAHIRTRFLGLSTPLKVRVLTSFLYLPSTLRESSKAVLLGILHDGETDPNEWVKKLSRILLPFVATGRVDLRETDTETAFRIIHFLDEQRAQHPEEGQYRRKAGLEQQHLCDPAVELAAAEAAAATAAAAKQTLSSPEQQLTQQLELQQPGPLEMTLFSARLNFDDLVKGIVRRGTQQLQQAVVSQQQREAAAAAAQQQQQQVQQQLQQQHSNPHVPLRKTSLVSGFL